MTDDLVKRLRRYPYDFTKEAADRIEELEAVLLEIANAAGDPSAYWIARTALEGKK